MAKSAKQKKPPPRRETSDEFVLTVGGTEYRPHTGEWVEWRSRSTIGGMIVGLRLQRLLRLSGLTEEEAEETSHLYEQVCQDLADSISGWSWTDDAGKEYPSPPTADVIRRLGFEEVFYLLGLRAGGKTEEEKAKNGSAPSTSH